MKGETRGKKMYCVRVKRESEKQRRKQALLTVLQFSAYFLLVYYNSGLPLLPECCSLTAADLIAAGRWDE